MTHIKYLFGSYAETCWSRNWETQESWELGFITDENIFWVKQNEYKVSILAVYRNVMDDK